MLQYIVAGSLHANFIARICALAIADVITFNTKYNANSDSIDEGTPWPSCRQYRDVVVRAY